MLSTEVQLEDADLKRIIAAIDAVSNAVVFYSEEAPRKMALAYLVILRKNIIGGKYSGLFPAYHPRYAEWKKKVTGSTGKFWVLFSDLIMALKVFPEPGRGYWAGVPTGVYDRGGKSWLGEGKSGQGKRKSIAMYGSVMEEGYGNHPARPLFTLTYRDFSFSGNLAGAGPAWTVGEQVLKIIGSNWK
jgi:hypothetical protein